MTAGPGRAAGPFPPHAVVAIPARDEQDLVGATLTALDSAVGVARRSGRLGRCVVELAAHRCRDRTAQVARAVPTRHLELRVVEDERSETVGEARAAAVRRGLAWLPRRPDRIWVLSTDADSVVGPRWVTGVLAGAERTGADAVVGLTRLDGWYGGQAGARAYEAIVADGLRTRGAWHEHDHVYGANLAVRADAYLAVGGFPHLHSGEDQVLVDRLAAAGHRVLRTRDVSVVTSGRLAGRAEGGLAGLLSRVDAGA